ncbi:HD domain-containing protein, partial [Clostridium perfringens]
SFRRLKHKTQVYIKTFGDHYRTRLTHTLEVSQIARTIGSGIGLNESLIEAIALGHDLGHVAFAHNGEEVLNDFLGGFRHNEQSVRVVEKLEKNGLGLNLTLEVIDGILHHSGLENGANKAKTLEGRIVKVSDKIA